MPKTNCGIRIYSTEKNRTGKPATSVTEQVTKRNIKRKWTGINLVLSPLRMKLRKLDVMLANKSPCLKSVTFIFLPLWQKSPFHTRKKPESGIWVLAYDVIPNTCFLELVIRLRLRALSTTFCYLNNISDQRTECDIHLASRQKMMAV